MGKNSIITSRITCHEVIVYNKFMNTHTPCIYRDIVAVSIYRNTAIRE